MVNNRSGTVKEYRQNFLLDEPKLRKIVAVVREQAKKLPYETYIEFYVERDNDVFYTTRELDDVIQNDNTIGHFIRYFSIELYKTEAVHEPEQKPPGQRKYIIFVGFTPNKDTKISVSVACEIRDWTFLTADELDTQIKRNLRKGNFPLLRHSDFLVAAIITYVGLFIGVWITLSKSSPDVSTISISSMTTNEQIAKILDILVKKESYPTYVLPTSLFTSFVLGWVFLFFRPISSLLSKSRTSFFYWGDMIQIHDKTEQRNTLIRWSLGIALLVSIVGSVIGTIIVTR